MSEKMYCVTAYALNVREAPSIKANVIGYLHQGDTVEYISSSGDGYWLKINNDRLQGWVSQKYLILVPSEPATSEEFSWMPIALAEQGTKEFPGDRDNPRVVEYLKSTNLSAPFNADDETAWCSGFVNWCIEHAGYEGTDSAWARSWLNWGKRLETPRRGCIVVFSRDTYSGHVGFYIEQTATDIKVLGGNQSDEVNMSNYPKANLLDYRIPG